MSTKDALLGSGALGILADGFLNGFDLILGSFDLLMGSVDILYPLALVATRVAPSFEWLDESLVTNVMLFIAALYAVHLLNKLRKRIQNDRT